MAAIMVRLVSIRAGTMGSLADIVVDMASFRVGIAVGTLVGIIVASLVDMVAFLGAMVASLGGMGITAEVEMMKGR